MSVFSFSVCIYLNCFFVGVDGGCNFFFPTKKKTIDGTGKLVSHCVGWACVVHSLPMGSYQCCPKELFFQEIYQSSILFFCFQGTPCSALRNMGIRMMD